MTFLYDSWGNEAATRIAELYSHNYKKMNYLNGDKQSVEFSQKGERQQICTYSAVSAPAI
jgi:hypothetical protein